MLLQSIDVAYICFLSLCLNKNLYVILFKRGIFVFISIAMLFQLHSYTGAQAEFVRTEQIISTTLLSFFFFLICIITHAYTVQSIFKEYLTLAAVCLFDHSRSYLLNGIDVAQSLRKEIVITENLWIWFQSLCLRKKSLHSLKQLLIVRYRVSFSPGYPFGYLQRISFSLQLYSRTKKLGGCSK